MKIESDISLTESAEPESMLSSCEDGVPLVRETSESAGPSRLLRASARDIADALVRFVVTGNRG